MSKKSALDEILEPIKELEDILDKAARGDYETSNQFREGDIVKLQIQVKIFTAICYLRDDIHKLYALIESK